MKTRLLLVTCCVMIALLSLAQWKDWRDSEPAFSKATIKYGSQGSDVRELQGRLKFLGYYHGNVDGDFGYQTLNAVKNFQSAFGMTVDGIAGSKTKLRLWEATKNWRPGDENFGANPGGGGGGGGGARQQIATSNHLGLSDNDLNLMANAVYGEARGEPYEGQVAVAAVILNRIKSASFPNTVSEVIFQPRAFTAVADGQIWLTPNERAKQAVMDAINGWDPSGGCIYYFNPDTATSGWIWTRPQVKQIGKHIFCM
ncbi:spore cortex-lytic enzyme [Xylanibacillus composti]|uniref:Spore cortex-lytic enzyme n=1 Tax=Xylanibacillus composti TaxID=1572762 RepID=A0A8J4M174_9BACL|nr:spore cortex-lytic enzyme [Xylanibacillus composti]GIQ68580.1 spore cortex-lytic enzyme [Xylanibacillus composti]